MSLFDAACKKYAEGRDAYIAFRDKSYEALHFVSLALGEIAEVPPQSVSYVKLESWDGPPVEAKRGTSPMAMIQHDETENIFYIGIVLTVFEAPNVFPHQPLLIRFGFRWIDDEKKWEIAAANRTMEKWNLSDTGQRERFIEGLFSDICDGLNFNPVDEGRQENRRKSFGFSTEHDD